MNSSLETSRWYTHRQALTLEILHVARTLNLSGLYDSWHKREYFPTQHSLNALLNESKLRFL
jgi:hypothetical protein